MPSENEPSVFEEEIAVGMNGTILERNKVLRNIYFRPNNTLVYIHVGSVTDPSVGRNFLPLIRICSLVSSHYFKAASMGILTEAMDG